MASPTSTNLTLPDNLPFPIRITNLIAKPNEPVSRGSPLCDYSFEYLVPASSSSNSTSDGAAGPSKPKREKETRYGRWECALDGTFDKWLITKGAVIRDVQHARQQPAAIILEECPHSMQLHGLCALCGKDMTGTDYLGTPSALATIPLTHSANGPTVTLSEAMRYDAELSQRLLNERKLSLIVDLDQTIVHATVDPTVGEWMSEREKWLNSHKAQQGDQLPAGEPTIDEEAEENPNWPALSDVKRFKLPGEGRTAEDDGSSWYYIKPRPGLASFLNNLKTKYEMHVYTMGTRAYAFEVCKAIDPDQSVFGQRVLTRDESGSMTSKNLQRLFPSDQSMVAVIDDRADVWADVPNLVKVNPYDFFVGIGDINSAHLPVVAPPPVQAVVIGRVVAERPLARMQEVLDAEEDDEGKEVVEDKAVEVNGKHEGAGDVDPNEDSKPEGVPQNAETPKSQHTEEKVKHKMLLHNNDWELIRVEEILNDVHQRFYAAYDQDPPRGKRTADLRNFITGRKREVFAGLHFTFSSVFPTNQDPRAQPIWRQAEKFGARCHATWNDGITHVIAVKLRSEKTERGQRKPGVFVLHPQWLWESVAQWRRVDEEPYVEMLRMLDEASAQAGSSTPAPAPHLDLAGSSASSSPEAGSSTGSAPIIVIEEMDWAAVNDELDAFLAETDDDDDMGLGDDDEDGDA
ncbi:hypothetical protein DL93DRAFT_2058638, partial [Clavulina sp. PMI_390]